MKQPVSRNSFDRRRGYLGVYLQEGAPLVDACWNEVSDIHGSLLRDSIQDAGLEGTAGIELRIDPLPGEGRPLTGLVVRGGPGRFYCGGLPILWPESRRIDAQGLDQEPLTPAKPWLDGLQRGVPYTIYVEASVEPVDALDRPDLDDPGLGAERGSFRTRVRARVRMVEGEPEERRTNVLLTIQGSYDGDLNVLYHVELLSLTGTESAPTATLLWDSDGAAVVARVTAAAKAYATSVQLSSTEGFEQGSYVRFEGPRVDGRVYEVVGRDANAITLRAHSCAPPLSMAELWGVSLREEGDGVTVTVEDPGNEGPRPPIQRHSRVKGLPRNLAKPSDREVWLVDSVVVGDGSRTFKLVPDGLVAPLDPWDEEHASELVLNAHPFHTCIEVKARPEWMEGMRVRIRASSAGAEHRGKLEFVDTESGRRCQPGQETVASDEDRTVVRIIRHDPGAYGEGDGPRMTLRLDRPLSFEHVKHAKVVPERLIRARRYQGHACEVPIDTLNPSSEPTPASPDSAYGLRGTYVLPHGLSLRLSVEREAPSLVPGDGWTFAARAGGWVEAPMFAPVEEIPRGWAPLARLTLDAEGDGYTLVDLRPVPASRAHHGWLAIIRDAADEMRARLWDEAAAATAGRIKDLAELPRAQRWLVPEIAKLAEQCGELLGKDTPACAALAEAAKGEEESPTDTCLSRISSAMARLACAIGWAQCGGWGARSRPTPPTPEEPAPGAPLDAAAGAVEAAIAPPLEAGADAVEAVITPFLEAVAGEPEPAPAPSEPPPPAPSVLDIGALPTRLVRDARTVAPAQRGKWQTLEAVPRPGSLSRERERRLAETVTTLLDQTAAIGGRAVQGNEDRATLQAALDALWKPRFQVDQLRRPIRVDDAVALFMRRSQPDERKP